MSLFPVLPEKATTSCPSKVMTSESGALDTWFETTSVPAVGQFALQRLRPVARSITRGDVSTIAWSPIDVTSMHVPPSVHATLQLPSLWKERPRAVTPEIAGLHESTRPAG